MISHEQVVRHKQRLDAIFKAGSQLQTDYELQSHWGRYCCVLASGFVEQSVRALVTRYSQKRSNAQVHRYIASHLKRFQNAEADRIIELLERFDPTIKDGFCQRLDEKHLDAVTSLVNVRHQIAHGESTGISLATVKAYYQSAVAVIETLDKILS